jgi:large subunit ribosomal protein L10
MENPRPEKVAVVDEVKERFERADAALLTEYRGLNVKALADLRRQLRPAGAEYKVYKNTLVRFAAQEAGAEGLVELLSGPTAITFVHGDAAAAAKTLRDYARTNPTLIVKGGLLGTKVLTPADVAALADLPSREVVLARLAGAFQAPLVKLAGLLQALPRNFAYGLQALIDDRGGVPGGEAAAPAADDAGAEAPPAESAAADAPAADAPAAEPPTEEPAGEPADVSATDEAVSDEPTTPSDETDVPTASAEEE